MRHFTIGLVLLLFVVGCSDDISRLSVTTSSDAPTPTSETPVTTLGVVTMAPAPTTTTTAVPAPTTTTPTTAVPAPTTTTPTSECPTLITSFKLSDEPDLPIAVDAMRRAIVNTALVCDIEGLGELARLDGFVWMGTPPDEDPNDPTEYFRIMEGYGWFLTDMLNLFGAPYGVENIDGDTVYVWPAAAAYPDWASVPEFARQGLVDLYGEGILEEAAEYLWEEGYYQGSELVIDEIGDWRWYWLAGN